MISTTTGDVRYATSIKDALERATQDEAIVLGKLEQIEALSRRVKLGEAELQKRKRRRSQQKASRRANR